MAAQRRTVLFAWELGGGLGHVLRFKPIAERLVAMGHQVFVALRDLAHAHRAFSCPGLRLLQAPIKLRPSSDRFEPPSTFAHILFNMAFGNVEELCGLVRAWQSLIDWTAPDVIVFDHSPTALLAARTRAAKRVLIGSGFCCPPACAHYPDWRPWQNSDPQQLQRDEDQVLTNANRVLEAFSTRPLARLSDLYGVDDTWLTTFSELDPFDRRGVPYWGVWAEAGGTPPVWRAEDGARVFAYLKPSHTLPAVLDAIALLQLPAVVYCPDIHPRLQARYGGSTLRFSDQPLDVQLAAQGCDLALLNATLNTTATVLLAGKPVLLLPLHLEQRLTAERVEALGAGRFLLPEQIELVQARLREMLVSTGYTEAARAFAEKYADFAVHGQLRSAVERLMHLATS